MEFAGMNYLAVGLAALAAFVFGAVYYGALSRAWMKAAGLTPEQAAFTPTLFVTTAVSLLVMAYVLAGVIGHLGDGRVTVRNGVISGGLVWLGFIITAMLVNHRYQGARWDLTLIDGAHWLIVALLMGAVIGFMGV
ncbi:MULTISPECIES: DUF1761 domain-containing protein [unclassified Roseitalea]|uniref:DUF1761 domain-containing protein n=1 Tax=unclassified Roseitalea TaxID=2639107 RepID=UPI00273EE77C|nr:MULTISPECIES: DUF1761 domain-containing protein [unclassified Roseitalea]